MSDYCDKDGAARIGAAIAAYWAKRGGTVAITYVDGPFTPQMRTARVDVRSDMVNGYPRSTKVQPVRIVSRR